MLSFIRTVRRPASRVEYVSQNSRDLTTTRFPTPHLLIIRIPGATCYRQHIQYKERQTLFLSLPLFIVFERYVFDLCLFILTYSLAIPSDILFAPRSTVPVPVVIFPAILWWNNIMSVC